MKSVTMPIDGIQLVGDLLQSPKGQGLVIFAHGSGSGRLSPRNQYVAGVLQKKNVGTLLFDLLTEDEDQRYENRFDIELLTERLLAATDWARRATPLPIGYFGASTGAAAALKAAAGLGSAIQAVVSRGGRPDLAMNELPNVKAPTLLIVGGDDSEVIGLNQQALAALRCEKQLSIVPSATHLFEEPGTLEQVAELAGEWFARCFRKNT